MSILQVIEDIFLSYIFAVLFLLTLQLFGPAFSKPENMKNKLGQNSPELMLNNAKTISKIISGLHRLEITLV